MSVVVMADQWVKVCMSTNVNCSQGGCILTMIKCCKDIKMSVNSDVFALEDN